MHGGIFLEAKSAPKVLENLNHDFLALHSDLAKAALNKIDNIIVYHQGELALWNSHQNDFKQIANEQITKPGDHYDIIKNIAHLPFYIKTLLLTDKIIDVKKLSQLKHNLDLCQNVIAHNLMIDKIRELIETLLKNANSVTNCHAIIDKHISTMSSEINDLCHRATEIQLTRLQTKMDEWKKKYNLDLTKTRVIVTGTHGARNGRIEVQYFVKYYKEHANIDNALNDQIYHSESLPSHLPILDVKKDLIKEYLGKSELNKIYGSSLNQDKKAMFKDLLASCAPKVLMGLFHKPATSCPMKWLRKTITASPSL